ncbi:CvpA family protein [Evansella cellulosilytica]|uniref:Colicin V production protein n=1 Tax=Evansella cellulosilytica (strain ATCC 21833 / DSM 2522 / FERM P-1141 / JCM 9156 / N-4) TaxID=649639 RepID=E6U0H7_EVAC2|nr:CvpA family protein [Evansella cellulosilytica]ADU31422.1 Colicin V production protein [Evansella cellulosilytica DSM 2522]
MLSFLLFFVLLICFFVGFRRGLILQLVHLLGFFVAFFVAYLYYQDVAHYIRLWIPFPQLPSESTFTLLVESFGAETVYYNGIAFAILFFATKIVMHIVGSLFDFLAHLPILNMINRWLGGILGFIEGLLIIVVLLHLAALIQIEFIQQIIQTSSFAEMIFEYTPVISDQIKELWSDVDV